MCCQHTAFKGLVVRCGCALPGRPWYIAARCGFCSITGRPSASAPAWASSCTSWHGRWREAGTDDISILSASWKDRPSAGLAAELGRVRLVDRRLPVRGLTWSWNRLSFPPVEWLAGPADVVHAQTPLVIPATRAARVVTIHDLDFLLHPERAEAEMRRDFPALVRQHVRRADHVVVSSRYALGEVTSRLALPHAKVTVCSPGTPPWAEEIALERRIRSTSGSLILFLGTLEPRKNIGGLLDAYARLRERRPDAPPLVLAGRARDECGARSRAPEGTSLCGARQRRRLCQR